jgi:hypothetical protein
MVNITDDTEPINITIYTPPDPNDFTTYTVMDSYPPSYTITPSSVVMTNMLGESCHYMYLALPAVQDFQIDFAFTTGVTGALDSFFMPFVIGTPTVNGYCYAGYGHVLNPYSIVTFVKNTGGAPNQWQASLRDVSTGLFVNTGFWTPDNTTRYARLSRVGSVGTLRLYTDAARTQQWGSTATGTVNTQPLTIISTCGSANAAGYGTTSATVFGFSFTEP